MKYTFLAVATALTSITAGMIIPANAATNEELLDIIMDLKNQIKTLEKRVDSNEEAPKKIQNTTAQAIKTNEASPEFGKGYIAIPGTSTGIKFGGYVKLDATYDVGVDYGNDVTFFSNIPLENSVADEVGGEFNMSVRQSRFNLTTLTKSDLGDIKVFLEGDFIESLGPRDTINRHGFGLRHAYASMGNWTFGQTWSNFMDMGAWPNSTDLVGPAGSVLIRQPLIKYSHPVNDNNIVSLALENPSGDINDSTDGEALNASQMPDITLQWKHKGDWGHISTHALAREIRATNNVTFEEESSFGWGLALSGRYKFNGKHQISGRYAYGDGIGRYLVDSVIGSNGAAGYQRSLIENQVAHGGYLNYRYFWQPNLQTNLIGGYVSVDNDVSIVGTEVNESIYSAHANIIWAPVDKVNFGLEYMHGHRELENGAEGTLNRIQATAIYKF